MRDKILAICAVTLAAGCGVNPDRLATMHEKNAQMSETSTEADTEVGDDSSEPPLQFDDNDPAPVREAIMSLQDLEKLVKTKRYQEYLTKRYELMRQVSYEASETLATSAKTPLIIDRVYDLDKRIADAAGGRAKENFATVGRVDIASSDALYSLNDALEACRKAVDSKDTAMQSEQWTKYEADLQRAQAVDAKSMTFVGKKVTGGGWVDVPVEIAVCEARMKLAKSEAEDAPPVAVSQAKAYQGCGYYAIELEAKQTGPNQFGDYLITSAYIADQDPGVAETADCGTIPPASDADSQVQKVVKDFVAWLKPTDVVSMDGGFKYEGPEGQKMKLGTARVYRRDAKLQSNACGSNDPKVTCEAEGSPLAKAYNQSAHYMGRADYHRGSGNTERCKRMADFAFKAANVTSPEAADKKFLVSNKQTLSRTEIGARLDDIKQKAQTAMSSDWCAKK